MLSLIYLSEDIYSARDSMTLGSKEAREARQRARDAYPTLLEGYPEWKILDALVKEPAASVTDAVQKVLGLAPAKPYLNERAPLGDHPYHTFLSLIEIAKRTPPENQTKLVEFVARLQKNVVMNEATGEPLRHEGYLVWTQLPALGYTAADEWHSLDALDEGVSSDEIRHYENLAALLAQLSAAADVDYGDPVMGEMDFSFWPTYIFKAALEREEGQPAPTDAALRVASLWFMYAADRLWANAKHGRVFGRRGDDPGTRMTREMWDRWQRGLVAAQATCNDEETRRLISSAIKCMENALKRGK
ncbi:hypothetical protein F4802DRAFT_583168 [Xylaria palmicola]|nr:hypothetical protein F4802DRAFT_583168 [Xylaria palmicola]